MTPRHMESGRGRSGFRRDASTGLVRGNTSSNRYLSGRLARFDPFLPVATACAWRFQTAASPPQLQVTAVGRTDKHTEWPLTDGGSERACLLTWELYGEGRSRYVGRLQIHCPTMRLHDLANNI
jgi:hypothetical protein